MADHGTVTVIPEETPQASVVEYDVVVSGVAALGPDIEPQTTGQLWPRSGGTTISGDSGGGGGAPTRYTHNQAVLASTWTITHNLGAHPAVSVEDAVGTVLYGTVQYLSDNALTVTFARTATGRANLI